MKKGAASVAAALAGLGSGVGGATTDGVGISIKEGVTGAVATSTTVSSPSDSSMSGEDIREARAMMSSYAPYGTHDGRVGMSGEIGAFVSSCGGGSPAQPVRGKVNHRTPHAKNYAIGSWKK